jgi:hypothetical protein
MVINKVYLKKNRKRMKKWDKKKIVVRKMFIRKKYVNVKGRRKDRNDSNRKWENEGNVSENE